MICRGTPLLVLLLLFVACSLVSCYNYESFELQQPQKQIRLFDAYIITFDDHWGGLEYVSINVAFVRPPRDTTGLDSLPIFKLDSVSLRNKCMAHPLSLRPSSWYEDDKELYRKGLKYDDERILVRGDDLYLMKGQVTPSGYRLPESANIAEECGEVPISTVLFARLIDRKSGKVISQESRTAIFQFKKYQRLEMH